MSRSRCAIVLWGLTAALIFAPGLAGRTGSRAAAAATHAAAGAADSTDGLARLKAGNARFVAGKPTHQHEASAWRAGLSKGQHPFAVILGCSDSRVPSELVFDQGFGDLFVVRVAGNVAATDELGSVEYAVHHLGVPLVVVLGHEQCGAVTAALGSEQERSHESAAVQELLTRIQPALGDLPAGLTGAERVHAGVESNVRLVVQGLRKDPELVQAAAHGLRIVGGVYELDTGSVRWLRD